MRVMVRYYLGLVPLVVILWGSFGLAASLWFIAGWLVGHLCTAFNLSTAMGKLIQQNNMLRVTPWNDLRCRCGAQLTDEDGKLKAWWQKP